MGELLDPTLDELAAALREDPVLVPQMFGNGRTEEVREGLREIVEEADFPVYVAMVPQVTDVTGEDAAREVATLLHSRLGGGDAVVAVHTREGDYRGTEIVSFGDAPGEELTSRAASENAPGGGANYGLSEPGLIARELTVLLREGGIESSEWQSFARQDPWRAPEDWQPGGDGASGADAGTWVMALLFGAFAAGAAFVLSGVVADRLAAARTAARARGTAPEQPGPEDVRAEAELELEALAAELAGAEAADGKGPAGMGEPARVRVDGSYDTARTLLERTGTGRGDLGDLVGALVLARVARHEVAHHGKGRGSRPGADPWRPCFVDPRHGEGTRTRRVPVADRLLEVPACASCADASQLWPMRVAAGPLGRTLPWYEHDTVWARTGYGAFVDDLWRPVSDALRTGGVER